MPSMDRHPEPLSLDDRLFHGFISGCRFILAHVGTAIILAVAALAVGTLWRYRLRIAAEAGAIHGAYERERAREIQKARDFGQGTKPAQRQDAAPTPGE